MALLLYSEVYMENLTKMHAFLNIQILPDSVVSTIRQLVSYFVRLVDCHICVNKLYRSVFKNFCSYFIPMGEFVSYEVNVY